MLSINIKDAANSLGVLAGRVDAETWDFLKIIKLNLLVQAEMVGALERVLLVPDQPETREVGQ